MPAWSRYVISGDGKFYRSAALQYERGRREGANLLVADTLYLAKLRRGDCTHLSTLLPEAIPSVDLNTWPCSSMISLRAGGYILKKVYAQISHFRIGWALVDINTAGRRGGVWRVPVDRLGTWDNEFESLRGRDLSMWRLTTLMYVKLKPYVARYIHACASSPRLL